MLAKLAAPSAACRRQCAACGWCVLAHASSLAHMAFIELLSVASDWLSVPVGSRWLAQVPALAAWSAGHARAPCTLHRCGTARGAWRSRGHGRASSTADRPRPWRVATPLVQTQRRPASLAPLASAAWFVAFFTSCVEQKVTGHRRCPQLRRPQLRRLLHRLLNRLLRLCLRFRLQYRHQHRRPERSDSADGE